MSTADQLAAIPPEIRCFALVGQLLSHWAELEATLDVAIQTAFQLDQDQTARMTKIMRLRDKIRVLHGACESCIPDPDRAHYKTQLDAISKYTAHRNLALQGLFRPDDAEKADGVMFIGSAARGRHGLPIVRWSIADFEARVALLCNFGVEMRRLEAHLAQFSRLGNEALVSTALRIHDQDAQERATIIATCRSQIEN